MIRRPTTIVIGAGSSCELKLPSGADLRSLIAQALQPDDTNAWQFRETRLQAALRGAMGQNGYLDQSRLRALVEAARRIQTGMSVAASIDNYLHTHQGNEDIIALGKYGIAVTILQAERRSLLFKAGKSPPYDHVDNLSTLNSDELQRESWLPDLARWIFTGVDKGSPELAFKGLRFIVFNYDRCLEQFLWLAAQAYFDIGAPEASFLMGKVEIVHPYGTVGNLPWQLGLTGTGTVEFGEDKPDRLFSIAGNVKTFTESLESDVYDTVKQYVANAQTLMFMGYGFAEQNNDLLRLLTRNVSYRAFATAYGQSDADRAIIYDAIGGIVAISAGAWNDRSLSGIPVFLEDGKCRDLMRHHFLQLSLR